MDAFILFQVKTNLLRVMHKYSEIRVSYFLHENYMNFQSALTFYYFMLNVIALSKATGKHFLFDLAKHSLRDTKVPILQLWLWSVRLMKWLELYQSLNFLFLALLMP